MDRINRKDAELQHRFTLVLPKQLMRAVTVVANRNNRSVTGQIIHALKIMTKGVKLSESTDESTPDV